MQEDTHYFVYHNIVESGYITQATTFSNAQHEDEQDFTDWYPQNDQHSEYYTSKTFLNSEDIFAKISSPQSSKLSLPAHKSNKNNAEFGYLHRFHMYTEATPNENSPEETLPATINLIESSRDTTHERKARSDILNTILFGVEELNILLNSDQYNAYQSVIQAIIDMLTLVIFIVLLRRWLQFDVLGTTNGAASDLFLESGGSAGARCRRKTRVQEHSRLEIECRKNVCREQSEARSIAKSASSSSRSLVHCIDKRSTSNYTSRSSIFDDDSILNTDSVEISISDEISSIITSSSLSCTDEDITDVDDDELDGDYNLIIGNVDEINTNILKHDVGDIIPLPTDNKAPLYYDNFSEENDRIPSKNNEETDLLCCTSSYDEENDDEYTVSELSWFIEHYQKGANISSSHKHADNKDISYRSHMKFLKDNFIVVLLEFLGIYLYT